MTILRSILLFALAAVAEIGGTWLIWQGVREHNGLLWIGAGIAALGAYAHSAMMVREYRLCSGGEAETVPVEDQAVGKDVTESSDDEAPILLPRAGPRTPVLDTVGADHDDEDEAEGSVTMNLSRPCSSCPAS